MLLFKYLSPEGALKTLARKGKVSMRFGLPRTYNDPYELFLQPDRPLESVEERAFYAFFLGEVLQAPVTCFSKRPDSVVMWAHYGRETTGACLAFDEDVLADEFEIAFLEDVAYSDKPAQVDASMIEHAFATGKRRHTLWALFAANRAAFFIKRTDWQYEHERRLVVPTDAVQRRAGMLIATVSANSVRYIIVGPRAPRELLDLCTKRAKELGIPLLKLKVGKKSYAPRFVGARREVFLWSDDKFEKDWGGCGSCHAELLEDGDCPWCSLSPEIRRQAGMRSGLAMSLYYKIDQGIPLVFTGLTPKGRATKGKPGPGSGSSDLL